MYSTLKRTIMQRKTVCWREKDDCSVIAVAIACDVCYAEAWYTLRKAGREYRGGVTTEGINQALDSLGYDVEHMGEKQGTFIDLLTEMQNTTALVYTQNHVIAWKDDVMHEWVGRGAPAIPHTIYTLTRRG